MSLQRSANGSRLRQTDLERKIPKNILKRLKPRERDVLVEFLNDPCAKRIAKRLGLSQSTVSNYLTSIRQYLGASNHAELMKLVLENRIYPPSTELGKITGAKLPRIS